MTTALLKLSSENERNYQQLVSQLEANVGIFGIFIVVCDDRNLRSQLIAQYERELKNIAQCERVKLDYKEPSLKSAVKSAIAKQDKTNDNRIITVLGADNLSFVANKQERSQQDKFLGYLQWTREGLRDFSCPIILWIDSHILVNLTNKAPDFWSWRNSVFRFESKAIIANCTIANNHSYAIETLGQSVADTSYLSREDLEQLIAETEAKRGEQEPTLVSLYHSLGELYLDRLQQGEAKHYADELQRAIKSFYKAIDLANTLELYPDLVISWNSLGLLYNYRAEYKKAIECWQKSLAISQQISSLSIEANSLCNLGNAYDSLGEYQIAIDYYQQSLAISQQIGSLSIEASSLCNLGNGYRSLGEYQTAIDYYQQSLAISQQIGSLSIEASSLINLGNAYNSLGEYQTAIEYCQQSLAISQQINSLRTEASSLINLGNAYNSLGEYQTAIDYCQQSLAISQQIGSLRVEANSLCSLAITFIGLADFPQAKEHYQNARNLYQKMNLQSAVEE